MEKRIRHTDRSRDSPSHLVTPGLVPAKLDPVLAHSLGRWSLDQGHREKRAVDARQAPIRIHDQCRLSWRLGGRRLAGIVAAGRLRRRVGIGCWCRSWIGARLFDIRSLIVGRSLRLRATRVLEICDFRSRFPKDYGQQSCREEHERRDQTAQSPDSAGTVLRVVVIKNHRATRACLPRQNRLSSLRRGALIAKLVLEHWIHEELEAEQEMRDSTATRQSLFDDQLATEPLNESQSVVNFHQTLVLGSRTSRASSVD